MGDKRLIGWHYSRFANLESKGVEFAPFRFWGYLKGLSDGRMGNKLVKTGNMVLNQEFTKMFKWV